MNGGSLSRAGRFCEKQKPVRKVLARFRREPGSPTQLSNRRARKTVVKSGQEWSRVVRGRHVVCALAREISGAMAAEHRINPDQTRSDPDHLRNGRDLAVRRWWGAQTCCRPHGARMV